MIYTVNTTVPTGSAVLLIERLHTSQAVKAHNHSHGVAHSIFLGPTDATGTATGIHLQAEETYDFVVPPGEEIWGRASAEATQIQMLVVTR